jgi:hypothetical protein
VAIVEPGPIHSQFSETAFGSLPAGGGSPYSASYARAGGIRTLTDRASFGPQHVARAVHKATGSRWPRARYVAPRFLGIMLALLPFVPTSLLDAVFRRAFGLGAKPSPRRTTPAIAAAALLAFVMIGPGVAAADPGPRWETIRTEDGIVVSRKEVPGSPFVAFRGEGDVDAPLLRVGSVLVDVAREKEWIDSVVDARVLRRINSTDYVIYSHLATPPTMTDRDFVADVTLTVDAVRRGLVVRMHSVDDPAAPSTGYVRGALEESSFTLTSLGDGSRTHVVAEIHCDPRGSVASFIVNFFQRNWGYKTLTSLRRQVGRQDVVANTELQTLLDAAGVK